MYMFLESENHISNDESRYVCVCYQHNVETNYIRNSNLSIIYVHHIKILFETFHKDLPNSLCTDTQKDSNTLWPVDGISAYCILL